MSRRAPRAPQVTLTQNRIYLLPTRFGLLMLAVAVLVWVGALNYAVSLAYVLSFWILALLLLSVFLAYRQLAGLALRAQSAGAVFAGDDAEFVVQLAWPHDAAGRVRLGWLSGGARERWLPDGTARLSLGGTVRGQLQMPALRVWTESPLGLVRAFAPLRLAAVAWVYPRPLQDVPRPAVGNGEPQDVAQQQGGDEFAGLTSWQPQQGMRRIAWRVYARNQTLAARDYASEVPLACQQVLDWFDYPPQMALEERLSRLCWRLLQLQQSADEILLNLPQQQLLLTGDITPGLLALAQYGVRDGS